jgi:hypothetical protein
MALLIGRILEMKPDNKFSIKRIQNSLANATCRKIGNGLYSLNKQDEKTKYKTGYKLNFQRYSWFCVFESVKLRL